MPLLCCCYCYMLLLSWNCHCACATTDESQQQQQQFYTVTTIIKKLMIIKILNNICRFICMLLLLLLHLSYVIQKDLLWSKTWNINVFKFGRQIYFGWWTPLVNRAWISGRPITPFGRWTYFGQWTPQSIEHGSLADHYTMWKTNLLLAMDTPSQSNMDL